ncbi:hypothetical protein [Leeuwenhoekiella marinoflava]|uniref:DUF5063 domain-containing protein n=2 Tax=Leeuwenhoekiella marinoflava TaxID=988 RepID=A0A4Q0PJ46_9FLAO|nr:hypothetical protein [Leeuwenhoekiella marinoflava]RXG27377.1 hypothetical protein DSL99_2901 [Leeuwenhoekiella marinoflava]SHF70880.1 hypothetical protein SAMN02745246_03223 [Leeuwenhoekiella marinoflava DSM 3653]
MESFLKLIHQITQYGTTPVVQTNTIVSLKKSLGDLYALYVNLNSNFDEQLYEEVQRLDYAEVYAHVKVNFPEFGYYNQISELLKLEHSPEVVTGDALDDLTDLIIDLSEVAWRLENTSLNDGLWYFNTLMKIHSEAHLLNLLTYLKALEP